MRKSRNREIESLRRMIDMIERMTDDEFESYADAAEAFDEGVGDALASGIMDDTVGTITAALGGRRDAMTLVYHYFNMEDDDFVSPFSIHHMEDTPDAN